MLSSCGQNVYSLRTTSWITCVFASTASGCEGTLLPARVNKSQFLHTVTDTFYAQLSTYIFSTLTSVKIRVFHLIHTTYNYKHQIKKGKK